MGSRRPTMRRTVAKKTRRLLFPGVSEGNTLRCHGQEGRYQDMVVPL